MQKVAVYDKMGIIEEQLRQMKFWKHHAEFFLLDTVRTEDALAHLLLCKYPDVVLFVKEAKEEGFWTKIRKMKERFHGIRLVIIGYEKTYEMTREAFLNGVFDYLVWPLKEEELEQTLKRIYDRIGLAEKTKYRLTKDRQIGKIASWIVEHVGEKMTLETIAEGVYMNPTYVSHIFKKVSGINLVDYITEVKMERAKVLLENSGARVADIAIAVGYPNVEYFARVFKKRTGVTPVVWQREIDTRQGRRYNKLLN